MKKSQGFTLIELVVVIVILGILAATALPKFVDFKSDAALAAAQGVAGALASATSLNYAKKQIGSGGVSVSGAGACGVAEGLLQGNGVNGFTIADAVVTTCSTSGTATCNVTGNSTTVSATITCSP